MRESTDTLTPAQVYRFAIDFCQPHLQFRAVGKVTGEVILSVLFALVLGLAVAIYMPMWKLSSMVRGG